MGESESGSEIKKISFFFLREGGEDMGETEGGGGIFENFVEGSGKGCEKKPSRIRAQNVSPGESGGHV